MGSMRMLAVAGWLALAGTGAWGQQMYKCGGSYQDRPCAEQAVQNRYSAGRFDVQQVNPDTDKDCARLVGEVMPYWTRLNTGESIESLRAEYDRKPVARDEKASMRELLILLKGVNGTPVQARGQLESQCMANKRRQGYATERELEAARSSGSTRAFVSRDPAQDQRLQAWDRRRAIEAERAAIAAERAARSR
jgi:hypothetical protein